MLSDDEQCPKNDKSLSVSEDHFWAFGPGDIELEQQEGREDVNRSPE